LSTLDLSIARDIRLTGTRRLQLRIDMFNAPNSAVVTERASTINLPSPADQVTITNLPFDPATRSGHRLALAAARRGRRRGHRISDSAPDSDAGAAFVLSQ
jgi:hypothetical protein